MNPIKSATRSEMRFGLATPRDLLDKAKRELGRLDLASMQPKSQQQFWDVQDSALNAAITLWHVTDWIAKSDAPQAGAAIDHAKKALATKETDPYKILREFLRRDSHMALCNSLANGAKHFVVDYPPAFDATKLFVSPSPGVY